MLRLRRANLTSGRWLGLLALAIPWKLLQAVRLGLRRRDPTFLLAYCDILLHPTTTGKWPRQAE
jgi:hypothetical protein